MWVLRVLNGLYRGKAPCSMESTLKWRGGLLNNLEVMVGPLMAIKLRRTSSIHKKFEFVTNIILWLWLWRIHMDGNVYTTKSKCHKVSFIHENDCEETLSLREILKIALCNLGFSNSTMITAYLFIFRIVGNGKWDWTF